MARRATYKGSGTEFLEGVPARHIDEDEWATLSKEQRETVRASSLYDVKTDAQMSGGDSSSAADSSTSSSHSGGGE